MCTGLEIAMLMGGAAGNVIQSNQVNNQQDAIVKASNQRMDDYVARNKVREDEATALFAQQQEQAGPEAAQADRAQQTDTRETAMLNAIRQNDPGAAVPTKGSASSVIGDVFRSEGDAARKNSIDTAKAKAKVSGFGDQLFNLDLGNAGAGRKIGTISGLAASDAGMLPYYQDLAGAQAAAKHRPSGIGSMLSSLATAGGMYMGSR